MVELHSRVGTREVGKLVEGVAVEAGGDGDDGASVAGAAGEALEEGGAHFGLGGEIVLLGMLGWRCGEWQGSSEVRLGVGFLVVEYEYG